MDNPFSWDHLTSVPNSENVLNAFVIIYVVIFAAGFLLASYYNYRPWAPPLGRHIRRRTVKQGSMIALWVFGVGLFFFLIRLLQINPLSFGTPIWMYLCFLAFLVMLGLFMMRARAERATEPQRREIAAQAARRSPYHAAPTRRPVRRRRV